MSRPTDIRIDVSDLILTQAPGGEPARLGDLRGVQLVVLLRHRH